MDTRRQQELQIQLQGLLNRVNCSAIAINPACVPLTTQALIDKVRRLRNGEGLQSEAQIQTIRRNNGLQEWNSDEMQSMLTFYFENAIGIFISTWFVNQRVNTNGFYEDILNTANWFMTSGFV